jgi:hypothetical protein
VSAIGKAAHAERRLADLARSRAHTGSALGRREDSEAFVVRQNILHYRDLLAAGSLNDDQLRLIDSQLAPGEAKLSSERASRLHEY